MRSGKRGETSESRWLSTDNNPVIEFDFSKIILIDKLDWKRSLANMAWPEPPMAS